MRGLTMTKQIELTMTADDWDLYDMPESKKAAEAINYVIMREFNAGEHRESVRFKAEVVMARYRECGASDTEPRYILDGLLDKLYGKE